MSIQDEIRRARELLQIHRRSLGLFSDQLAIHTLASAPPQLLHNIDTTIADIAQLKQSLREWGAAVEDHPLELTSPYDVAVSQALVLIRERRYGHARALLKGMPGGKARYLTALALLQGERPRSKNQDQLQDIVAELAMAATIDEANGCYYYFHWCIVTDYAAGHLYYTADAAMLRRLKQMALHHAIAREALQELQTIAPWTCDYPL